MNDLISIIIPVYNAGKTIDSCVESVLKSTYSDFEILIFDDGSNVETAEECDKVALKDQRIKVIHQENGGVSKARNCGIENAKGKFITFVDADDMVDSDLLAKMGEDNITAIKTTLSEQEMAKKIEMICKKTCEGEKR